MTAARAAEGAPRFRPARGGATEAPSGQSRRFRRTSPSQSGPSEPIPARAVGAGPLQPMRERSTEIGKLLSSYLEKKSEVEDHSVHLLFSANRWEHVFPHGWLPKSASRSPLFLFSPVPAACSPERLLHLGLSDASGRTFRPLIKEKLSQGVTLVVDRYAFSGVAFTSAKENFSLDWCKQADVGLPKPDLVVFLQLQLPEAAARGEFGRERYESSPFQQRALQRFQQLLGDSSLPWKGLMFVRLTHQQPVFLAIGGADGPRQWTPPGASRTSTGKSACCLRAPCGPLHTGRWGSCGRRGTGPPSAIRKAGAACAQRPGGEAGLPVERPAGWPSPALTCAPKILIN
ncbi:thymidylate kinase isoform X2 [Balaenoptera musculus]|uniref:dTMP kinase n=1 Tax=Balaenoptera musculus TaxID=9771 RepID=A0A8B8XWL0_BALMU|nr:thymidylate kinase isoform X2 [Balaenoptera musculus]